MPNQNDRVVIDTNLWISFLLTNDFSKLDKIIEVQGLTLVLCQTLIDELVEVTQRPKFRKYFSLEDTEDLLSKMRNRGILIRLKTVVSKCRDPKDNFLLSLCVDGYATHLITGDKDLLVLDKFGATKILTMTDYLETF